MTLPLPIQLTVYSKLTGGGPDYGTAETVASMVSYEHSITDRAGFESLRATLNDQVTLLDETAALAWLDPANLMRPLIARGPLGQTVWRGVLTGVRITISGKTFSIDLADMANRLIVHYQTGGENGQDATTALEDTASIAAFGRKDRILSLDDTTDAGALQRAQTGLNEIAYPQSRESSDAAYDALVVPELYHRSVSVELTGSGYYTLLDWVTFSDASTTLTATGTQVANLLTDYAAVNAFFDPTDVSIVSTGVTETENAGDDSTYKDKIEKLLSLGNSSHVRLAWGFYETDFVVAVSARATPSTITYNEFTRTGMVTDAANAVVQPWDVRPNAMALVADVTPAATPSGAIDGPARKYVARVRCSVDEKNAKATLEPGNDDPLDALLAHPLGNPTTESSARTSALARQIASTVKPYASRTNGAVNLARGSLSNTGGAARDLGDISTLGGTLQPTHGGTGMTDPDAWSGTGGGGGGGVLSPDHGGTGIDNGTGTIDTGGGNIGNTGGGNIDLGTGAGIGSAGTPGTSILTSSGTPGRITQWAASGTAIEDAALVRAGTGLMTLSTHPTLATTFRLLSGGTTTIDGGGGGGWIDLQGAAFLGVNGTALQINANVFTLDADFEVDPSGATNGQALVYNSGVWEPGAAGVGSGTAGRITQWATGGTTIEDSTLIKSGAGVLTLSSASAYTLTVPKTGTAVVGTGTASKVATWTDANTIGASSLDLSAYPSGGGTTGRMAEWANTTTLQASTFIKTGTGVITLASSITGTLTIATIGTLDLHGFTVNIGGNFTAGNATTISGGGTIALGGFTITIPKTGTAATGTGTANKVAYWTDANTLSASSIDYTSLIGGSGTSGRLVQWTGTLTQGDSTLIKSGAGVLTISAGSTQTMTIGGSTGGTLTFAGGALDLAGFTLTAAKTGTLPVGTGTTGKVSYWSDANTLTASTVDASALVSGSGTTGRMTEWASASTLQASTLIKGGAGVLTLSSASSFTVTFAGAGTIGMNGGTINTTGTFTTTNTTTISGGGTIALGAHTISVGGDLTVGNATTISGGGTLSLNTHTLTVGSDVTVGGGVSGNIVKYTSTNVMGDSGIATADLVFFSSGAIPAGQVVVSVGGGSVDGFSGFDYDGLGGDLDVPSAYKVNGTQVLGARIGGWATPTGSSSKASFDTAMVTLQELAEHVRALIIDAKAHGFLGP